MQKVEVIFLPFATKRLPRHFHLSKVTIGFVFLSLLAVLVLSAYVVISQATGLYHNWQLTTLNKDHKVLLDSLSLLKEKAIYCNSNLEQREASLREISLVTETKTVQKAEPEVLKQAFAPWNEMGTTSSENLYTRIFSVEGIEKSAIDKVNSIWYALNQLTRRIDRQNQWAETCHRDMQTKYNTWAHIPSVYPIEGAITSKFGALRSLFGGPKAKRHQGVDIAGPIGLSVKATADGTVFFAGWASGYGNLVVIDHENGYYSYYGHCSLLKVVEGQKVKRYQTIALLGNTGRSTGPHVHYEIREQNLPRNPAHFIEENPD